MIDLKLDVEGDKHGYVVLRDVMGSDHDIANAARISYDSKGTSGDRALLRYLMRHKHTSPFEMAELQFEIKMPIFVARQWIRHRTANVNEMSARYTELPDEMFVPEYVSSQSVQNKQGREHGPLSNSDLLRGNISITNSAAYLAYTSLLADGVARETARGVLPLNVYTKMVWKMDLHNLFHFLKLRLDPHAQKEIRAYAEVIEKIVAQLFPHAYEAWVDYSKCAMNMSRMELNVIEEILWMMNDLHDDQFDATHMCKKMGMSDRETKEFQERFFNEV